MNEGYTFFYSGEFSQWHPSFFKDSVGFEYTCAEQYMMYHKALLFNDMDTADKIMSTDSPRAQKVLGRMVRNFDPAEWNKEAREIVYAGNMFKFAQNPDLLTQLIATDGTTLVEASPYDRIWGIGLSLKDAINLDPKYWRGTNWLGEILTKVREDLI